MIAGAGIETDSKGVPCVPLTTVATGTHGEAADEMYYECPLSIGNPQIDPSLSALTKLYRGLNVMEGRLGPLVVEPEELSVQSISLLQLLDGEIQELRIVEIDRRRSEK